MYCIESVKGAALVFQLPTTPLDFPANWTEICAVIVIFPLKGVCKVLYDKLNLTVLCDTMNQGWLFAYHESPI